MLEKARQMIDKIEQNEYLTAAEAWFMHELLRLMQPLPDDDEDDDEGEGEELDCGVFIGP